MKIKLKYWFAIIGFVGPWLVYFADKSHASTSPVIAILFIIGIIIRVPAFGISKILLHPFRAWSVTEILQIAILNAVIYLLVMHLIEIGKKKNKKTPIVIAILILLGVTMVSFAEFGKMLG